LADDGKRELDAPSIDLSNSIFPRIMGKELLDRTVPQWDASAPLDAPLSCITVVYLSGRSVYEKEGGSTPQLSCFSETVPLHHAFDGFAIHTGFLGRIGHVPIMTFKEIQQEVALE
jgi:hypothetical protein